MTAEDDNLLELRVIDGLRREKRNAGEAKATGRRG